MKDSSKPPTTPCWSWFAALLVLGLSASAQAENQPAQSEPGLDSQAPDAGVVLGKWILYEGESNSILLLRNPSEHAWVVLADSIQCDASKCDMEGVRLQRGSAIFRARKGVVLLNDESVKLEGLGIQAQKES